MNKLKKIITNLILLIAAPLMLTLSFSPALVYADAKQEVQGGINSASGAGTSSPGDAGDSLSQTIARIINVLSVAVAVAAVVVIIIGGFRYVVSAGNDTAVAAARKTIMFAVVGLIIAAVAQLIVKFVLYRLNTDTAGQTSVPQCLPVGYDNATHTPIYQWDSGPQKGKSCTK